MARMIQDWSHKYQGEVFKLEKYIEEYLFKDRVQEFIGEYSNGEGLTIFDLNVPNVMVRDSCGARVGAQTWVYKKTGEAYIEISSWMLEDINEAKGVMRHELSHYVKEYCGLDGRPHGANFNKVLKVVSPRYFRRDRYWRNTKAIEKARLKLHPFAKRDTKLQCSFAGNCLNIV